MKLAIEMKDHLTSETKGRIVTVIEPYSGFHIAENYHQKHSLRLYPEIMKEISAKYPDIKSLINSTEAARVNGFLGGYGSCDSLKEEIEGFGLSRRTKEILTSSICGRSASVACPIH